MRKMVIWCDFYRRLMPRPATRQFPHLQYVEIGRSKNDRKFKNKWSAHLEPTLFPFVVPKCKKTERVTLFCSHSKVHNKSWSSFPRTLQNFLQKKVPQKLHSHVNKNLGLIAKLVFVSTNAYDSHHVQLLFSNRWLVSWDKPEYNSLFRWIASAIVFIKFRLS